MEIISWRRVSLDKRKKRLYILGEQLYGRFLVTEGPAFLAVVALSVCLSFCLSVCLLALGFNISAARCCSLRFLVQKRLPWNELWFSLSFCSFSFSPCCCSSEVCVCVYVGFVFVSFLKPAF
jgi:hypothetical protein